MRNPICYNCQAGLHGNCTNHVCKCPCKEGDIARFAMTLVRYPVVEEINSK